MELSKALQLMLFQCTHAQRCNAVCTCELKPIPRRQLCQSKHRCRHVHTSITSSRHVHEFTGEGPSLRQYCSSKRIEWPNGPARRGQGQKQAFCYLLHPSKADDAQHLFICLPGREHAACSLGWQERALLRALVLGSGAAISGLGNPRGSTHLQSPAWPSPG